MVNIFLHLVLVMVKKTAWQNRSQKQGRPQPPIATPDDAIDEQALQDGIQASLDFAAGNCLASATGSSSSSSRPSNTDGSHQANLSSSASIVEQSAAGNCSAPDRNSDEMPDVPPELTEAMKAANLDNFARTALESLHLGAVLYNDCNQKKAALGRVPPDASTCLASCALIFEKFFTERKVAWANSEIAIDVLKRAESICGEFERTTQYALCTLAATPL